MWREFNLINSYTLEASFLGPNRGENAGLHFNTTHLTTMGRFFCKSLVDYACNTQRVSEVVAELRQRFPQGGTSVRSAPNQYNNKTDEDKEI